MTRALTAGVLIAATALACAKNPATGRRQFNILSENQEISLGRGADTSIRQEMGVYADPAWQEYVSRIGREMAAKSHRPTLPWSFAVVDSPAVNAFALPGGFIYLTRGILPFLRDEAEMAGVLGHEIAHVTAKHGANAYSEQITLGVGLGVGRLLASPEQQGWFTAFELSFGLLFLKHGRDAEFEADRLGVGYAAGGGWDPIGMAGLLATLGRLSEASGSSRGVPNFLSTHPLPEDRVARVKTEAASVAAPAATRVNADEFTRRLDGLVFGDSREQGILRGRDFLHPILRFAVRFPAQWDVANGASQVVVRPEGNSTMALLLEIVDAGGRVPAQAGRARMAEAGLTEVSGENTTINGLQAFVGVFRGGTGSDRQTVRVAYIAHDGRLYQLAGLATDAAFTKADPFFRDTIGSFRPMSAAEADGVQPARIDFHTVRAGETWASIASGMSGGAVGPASLAIMNGADPASTPQPGTRIRVVVGG